MRKPSEYIAAAAARVRDSLMSDCSLALAHGDRTATVTRVTTLSRGADAVSDSGVSESIRVLALASDLPDIAQGDPAELDDTFRCVTSVRLDPSRTMQYIGLSSPFDEVQATYGGTRRGTSAAYEINPTLPVLLHDDGNADDYSGALAPTYARRFTAAIRATDWTYDDPPEPSDTIDAIYHGEAVALKVSTVTPHAGWYILQCRTRG